MTARLSAQDLTLKYGDRTVSDGLTVDIPDGAFTAIIGANASGKSTLLRAFVRLLRPSGGAVLFDGRDVHQLRPKAIAQEMAFLPQDLAPPDNILVRQLVDRGRFPHRSVLSVRTDADLRAVDAAMDAAGVTDIAERPVARLSGGQRQRVWIAMVLAQETPYILLDEPTTFLDLAHQYQLFRLLAELRDDGRTIVTVLHDVNQACRYADHIIAVKSGRIRAEGPPGEVVDAELIEDVLGLPCLVVPDPVTGTPLVVPTEAGVR